MANGLRVILNSASLSFTTEELPSRERFLPQNIEISVGNGTCFLRSILVFQTVFLRWVHPNISQRASGETYRKARLCLQTLWDMSETKNPFQSRISKTSMYTRYSGTDGTKYPKMFEKNPCFLILHTEICTHIPATKKWKFQLVTG